MQTVIWFHSDSKHINFCHLTCTNILNAALTLEWSMEPNFGMGSQAYHWKERSTRKHFTNKGNSFTQPGKFNSHMFFFDVCVCDYVLLDWLWETFRRFSKVISCRCQPNILPYWRRIDSPSNISNCQRREWPRYLYKGHCSKNNWESERWSQQAIKETVWNFWHWKAEGIQKVSPLWAFPTEICVLSFLTKVSLHRERKFIVKANKHIQNSAQKFTDEAALLKACFFNLEEDIVYHERRSSRMHLRRWAICSDVPALHTMVYMLNFASYRYDNAVKDVVELQKIVRSTTQIRGEEDVELLDTLIETQGLLQRTVICFYVPLVTSCTHAQLFCWI
mgnify:CR=1 FL=1